MKKGKLLVFSAPSGSGKTTIVQHLLQQEELHLAFSVSATTRDIRGKEVNGKDYHFLTLNDFKNQIQKDAFVEWEEVYKNNFYGTLKTELERIWKQGKHVIFDIDVMGGMAIKKKFPEQTLAIFVQPPSIKEMERRLRNRKTDSEDKIKERVAKAVTELALAKNFDYILINDDLEKAKKEAFLITKKFLNTTNEKKK